MAHDFNNLLTVINGYGALLLNGLKAPDALRSYAEAITEAGDSAAKITSQLLAFSRKQITNPRVLDLNAIISASVPMLQRLITENIAVEMKLGNALGQVMADPAQVQQVLMNFVVNARDASLTAEDSR